jgi:uncharacterized protein YbgA (DUF1722 family)/uncharacterized protein YbbK (DUF523 family)
MKRLRLGVSACLLGDEVRYDGSHKRDRFLTDQLGTYVDFVTVCPEVGAGMGVPRETVRLIGPTDRPRVIAAKSGTEWTAPLAAFAEREVARLAALDLAGFVLKSGSPSCGMERVRVYDDQTGMPAKAGVGVFARRLLAAFPLMPVEEEGRLRDPALREAFLHAIFAYARLAELREVGITRGRLGAFHAANKYLLLAHSPAHYQSLGRVVAEQAALGEREAAGRYCRGYMEAMKTRPSVRKHVNVLQHMAGFFRTQLDRDGRSELAQSIADYRAGLVPLAVPIALVRHHAREYAVGYLNSQTYLEPAPKELKLRVHVP